MSLTRAAVFLLLFLTWTAGASGQGAPATIPPGWHTGDTHGHMQECNTSVPDKTLPDMYATQVAEEVDVLSVLLWSPGGLPNNQTYLTSYAPLVTGQEEVVSQGDPDHHLQFDVEVSGFAASSFGHVIGLHLRDAAFDIHAPYPKPILDFFRAQPGAITGYAHVRWFRAYTFSTSPLRPLPYMAPVDLALGKIDFIEAKQIEPEPPPNVLTSWTGLYYKLLRAGLRVGLSGGTDTCGPRIIGESRTYALLPAGLTYDAWTQAIAAGRTSIASGKSRFLHLTANGSEVGGQVDLAAPQNVTVSATIHVAQGVSATDTIEIVLDGAVVASRGFSLASGGTHTFATTVPVNQSGWLAARTSDTHTAAIYVIVDGQPIARALDAGYWSSYCDTFSTYLDQTYGSAPGTQEVRQHIAEGKKVFDALLALDGSAPAGIVRYGRSTPSCQGPIAIGTNGPAVAGDPSFKLTCLNAPPDSVGVLFVSAGSFPNGVPTFVTLYVNLLPGNYLGLLALSTGGGYSERPLVVPPGMTGIRLYCQYVWNNTAACGGAGTFSASDALDVTIQ